MLEEDHIHIDPKTLPPRYRDTLCLHRNFARIAVRCAISNTIIISSARSKYVRARYVNIEGSVFHSISACI